jgi:hypothetical protein
MADPVSLPPQPAPAPRCADCGAAVAAEATSCWLCGKGLRASATGGMGILPVPAGALATRQCHPANAPQVEQRAVFQFSLASILLIITLCAVVLGAFSVAPGLGIGLAILATPAAVCTGIVAMRRRAGGQPMSVAAKVGLFVGTLVLVMVIAIVVLAPLAALAPAYHPMPK